MLRRWRVVRISYAYCRMLCSGYPRVAGSHVLELELGPNGHFDDRILKTQVTLNFPICSISGLSRCGRASIT